jgi:hypothetical protein
MAEYAGYGCAIAWVAETLPSHLRTAARPPSFDSASPPQNVRDLDRRPCATARGRDTARRQSPRDAARRMDAAPLYFTNHWQDVRGVTVCAFLAGRCCRPSGLGEFRVTEAFASRFGCLESSRCPCADDLALVLGNSRQDMDGQLVGMRIIDSDELHAPKSQRAGAAPYMM